jgi:uroporphyrinogen-III synthase
MPKASFENMRVLTLESRRANEIATLIARYEGSPIVAPALREVTIESDGAALNFAAELLLGRIDVAIFLTGAGVRALFEILNRAHPGDEVRAALSRVKIAARGPKPSNALRELNVPVWVTAPEPNTWRELLAAMDARAAEQSIAGARVAVHEYGVPNQELLDALDARGAVVMRVPVYKWALPDDLGPLKDAVSAIAAGRIPVLLLTSGIQLAHLWQVVEMMRCETEFRRGLSSTFIASIGPTTSEELARRGLTPAMEASRPKLGFLVKEAAEWAAEFLVTHPRTSD